MLKIVRPCFLDVMTSMYLFEWYHAVEKQMSVSVI